MKKIILLFGIMLLSLLGVSQAANNNGGKPELNIHGNMRGMRVHRNDNHHHHLLKEIRHEHREMHEGRRERGEGRHRERGEHRGMRREHIRRMH